MACRLLDLPPELLAKILKLLPVRSLLRFSQLCRLARTLANSNVHTVSLAVQAIHNPTDEQHCDQKHCVRILDAHAFDYKVLFEFHNALLTSVVLRHADSVHTLDLSIWTLTDPIAQAISGLFALREFSVKIEDDLCARAVPKSCIAVERREQENAWNFLCRKAVWRTRLHRLKVQNADLNSKQLTKLLGPSHCCEELWLSGCRLIGNDIWNFLGHEWKGRTRLQSLHVADSCWSLDENSLSAISGLTGLQVCGGHAHDCNWGY